MTNSLRRACGAATIAIVLVLGLMASANAAEVRDFEEITARMVRAAEISGYSGGPVSPAALVPRPG